MFTKNISAMLRFDDTTVSRSAFLIGIEVRTFKSRDTPGTTAWRSRYRMWNGQARIPTNRAQRCWKLNVERPVQSQAPGRNKRANNPITRSQLAIWTFARQVVEFLRYKFLKVLVVIFAVPRIDHPERAEYTEFQRWPCIQEITTKWKA